MKSFLLPGWGQFSQRRFFAGVAFAAVEASAISLTIVYAIRGDRAFRQYQNARTAEEALFYRRRTVAADRVRNIGLVSAVVVWGLNVLDAALAERRSR